MNSRRPSSNTVEGQTSNLPGTWIREARQALGLSVRDLARLAEVSYPTVSRIELGHDQPRWDTLSRLLRSLGLSIETQQPTTLPMLRLADLTHDWKKDRAGNHEPEWRSLRAFADLLREHPELIAAAICPPPPASGSEFIDCLLAAIAEKVADDAELARPAWTRSRPPMTREWEPLGTPRMREANRRATPKQFTNRGIFLDVSTIWRTQSGYGAPRKNRRRTR
jgi:transcriptional regulator with XRE-family HTH domain